MRRFLLIIPLLALFVFTAGVVIPEVIVVATGWRALIDADEGATTELLLGGGAGNAPVWGTDIPTAVTIGTAYVYRAGGTDMAFADGGTGLSSWTQYLIPYAATAGSIGQIAIGTAGQPLLSAGAGAAPAFGDDLATATTIGAAYIYRAAGTDVPVTDGGTGVSTLTTAYGLLAAGTTATGAVQTLPAGATTEILVGGGAAALPSWTTATGEGAPVRATSPSFVTSTAITGTNGAILTDYYLTEVLTVAAAANTATSVTISIPAGELVQAITYRVTQAPGGGPTNFNCYWAQDSNDQDCLIDNAAVTVDTTGSTWTSGDATYMQPFVPHRSEAYTLTLVTTDGSDVATNVTGASFTVRFTVWLRKFTAPTS